MKIINQEMSLYFPQESINEAFKNLTQALFTITDMSAIYKIRCIYYIVIMSSGNEW